MPRRRALLIVLATAALGLLGWAWWQPVVPLGGVVLVPLGEVEPVVVDQLADDLAHRLRVPVRRLPPEPLAADAWWPERQQYDAERLLQSLEPLPLEPGEHLLAVAEVDGARADLTFVLGLAQLRGDRAVLFLPRLRRRGAPDLLRRRLLVTAQHELGHELGLSHCRSPHCVMQFSVTALGLDDLHGFCANCRERLTRSRGREVPERP